ncbi:hypothetical protein LSAT2_021031 [Lamellibrachia satsuma]|nr:hypothetical protein LSAT2_021031 [Lamellibrachia satsuma]
MSFPPSIVPPTTVASTKLRHTGDRRGTTDSGVTSTASKHDTAAATVPSGGTTQNRPKRYSSQRQRNAPEVVAYQEPVATDTQPPPAPVHVAPRGLTSPPRPLRRPAPQAYFQPVYATQPPTVFHPRADRSPPHTVASFPRQHPPHLLAYTIPGTNQLQSPPQIYNAVPAAMAPPPPSASMATAQPTPIIAPQYIAGAPMLNYVQPGQPAPYQMATGPAAMQFPAPQQPQPQPQPQQPQQQDAIHMRGGTVYFNPDVQQQLIPSRSPVRRVKVAIPIVNPEEVVQNQGMYIQINDNQQPAYAPTYYHLTAADFDQYDQEDDTEYDDMEDARPDAEAEAAEPEFYECVEPASGSADEGGNSQETSDAVSRKTPETSEEIVHKDDRTSTDGSRDVDSVKNIESESSSASTNENKTTDVTVIEENVRTENERDIATVKVESETVVGDSEQTSAEIAEDDTTQSDKTSEEHIKSESDPVCADTVDVTSEASDHKTDHACEDHTTNSDQETAEAACVENNSRKNECGHTEIESDTVSADEGSAKSETTNNETDPESVYHVSNPKQHLEAEASSVKELDIDLDEGKTDLANTEGEVSTSVSEGDSENRQIETENELAGSEEVSFKTETTTNDASDKNVKEVSEVNDASVVEGNVSIKTETTTNEASDKNVKEVSEVNDASVVEGNVSIKTETTTNEASDKNVKEVSEVNDASVMEGNASIKTETTTNEASDKNVEEVSQVNNASVMEENASSVDIEEGSGSTDVIKEEITEAISPAVDSSSMSDVVKIKEPVSGGMPV